MQSRVARWTCPYGATRRVWRGPARGFRVVVEPGLGLSYIFGTADAAPRFFERVIERGMTILDVGANKGQMTLLFVALVGRSGRVVAIEPAPAECQSLDRNVRLNGLDNVEIIEAAAADTTREMLFAYSAARPTQGKLVDVERTYQVANADLFAVRTMTLDSLLDRGTVPDMIKIDAEGGAAATLAGSRRLLDECRPRVYVELHGPEERAAIRDELIERGYVVETLDGRRVTDPTAPQFNPLWCYPRS